MPRIAVVPVSRGRSRSWAALAAALAIGVAAPATCSGVASAATGGRAAASHGVRVLPASAIEGGALRTLFAKHRGLSTSALTGVRPGSLRVAAVTGSGRQWAVASFRSASGLSAAAQVALQDGGDTGIFTRRSGDRPWTLAARGAAPLACDRTLPGAVRAAWRLGSTVRCGGEDSLAVAAARRQTVGGSSISDRIASIALSQVGESDMPVNDDFTVDCDPYTTLDGPVYAGPSYRGCEFNHRFDVENENEEWCSDFADWVWREAGVTQDMGLITPGANSFEAWGAAQGEPLTVDATDPQVGDAVVFYEPGPITTTTPADHVGIVTSVNSNGTVDLVDGDFAGASNTSVEYDPNVDLKTWASQVWSPGEQWVFVTPPTGAQPTTPTATVAGPHAVAAGSPTTFTARAAQAGGSITSEQWSFGDGNGVPGATATGSVVHHVFADPGRETVTVIVTSSLHTITVRTWNVDVVTPSSTVAVTPSDAVYYNDGPVSDRLFTVSSTGALTEESFDGASWLDESLPGAWSPGAAVATLDGKVNGALTPHVFARSASGGLQEATLTGATWTVQTIAGSPAPGSPIVAADIAPAGADGSVPVSPAVFYRDASGQLVESTAPHGSWTTSIVSGARGDRGLALGTVPTADGPALALYTTTRGGALRALVAHGRTWVSTIVAAAGTVVPGSPLAAVDSDASGSPAVFFLDRADRVMAATPGPFQWHATRVSTAPADAAGGLQAGDVVTATGTVVPEVAALNSAGVPQLSSENGDWSTQALPGTATSLAGLATYPVAGNGEQLLLRTAGGLQADAASGPDGPWTATTLSSTPATFPDRVLLYAADPTDLQAAQTAAAQAGLASTQVTGDFATAWADGVSGDYLVIAVGDPASSALYVNGCGWANPSGAFAGSTPFTYVLGPLATLPGADVYELASGATSADTATLADDDAYDAAHGSLPAGTPAPASQVGPSGACSGSPTATS